MGLSLSSSFSWRSFKLIAAIATGRINVRQSVEVEICDCLQCLACWRSVKAIGKRGEPCNVFWLQGEQFADSIAPALRAASPIRRPAVSYHRHRHLIVPARPMACLPLGVAESMLSFRLATSWHGFVPRYVTGVYGSGLGPEAAERRLPH
jgi:hypothetical protein